VGVQVPPRLQKSLFLFITTTVSERKDFETIPIENLIRLCKWLGADERFDFERSNLINWLVFMGYCFDPNVGGWR
jgi:hypothetical protein